MEKPLTRGQILEKRKQISTWEDYCPTGEQQSKGGKMDLRAVGIVLTLAVATLLLIGGATYYIWNLFT